MCEPGMEVGTPLWEKVYGLSNWGGFKILMKGSNDSKGWKFGVENIKNLSVLWAEFCPSKFICWKSSTWYLRTWLYLETGPLRRWLGYNEVIRVGPNPNWLVSLKEGTIRTQRERYRTCAQRKDHVRTQQEGGHLQVKGPEKKPDLPTPWFWTCSLPNCEKNFCCLSHPVCGILLWHL